MIANTTTQQCLPLEDVATDDRTYINHSLWFVDRDGYRVVFYHHEPLYRAALLVCHGVLPIFEKVYGSLGPAFYGLRTTVVALFLLALLRIKRPENLKEYGPGDLGRILGLDRVPEVKTVRRKLSRMAAMQRGKQLMEELAQQRIDEDEDRIAFLYIDGHVREYHGKHRLFKAKKSQRQAAGPAATDTWVNDAQGDPLSARGTRAAGHRE